MEMLCNKPQCVVSSPAGMNSMVAAMRAVKTHPANPVMVVYACSPAVRDQNQVEAVDQRRHLQHCTGC